MRHLDIERSKSGLNPEPRCRDVIVFQALQFVIGDDGIIGRRAALLVDERIVVHDRPRRENYSGRSA